MNFEKALEIGKSGSSKMDKYFNYKTNVNFEAISHVLCLMTIKSFKK